MTILTHVLAQGCRPTSNLSIAYELRCFWLPKVSSRARSDRSGLAVRWEPLHASCAMDRTRRALHISRPSLEPRASPFNKRLRRLPVVDTLIVRVRDACRCVCLCVPSRHGDGRSSESVSGKWSYCSVITRCYDYQNRCIQHNSALQRLSHCGLSAQPCGHF